MAVVDAVAVVSAPLRIAVLYTNVTLWIRLELGERRLECCDVCWNVVNHDVMRVTVVCELGWLLVRVVQYGYMIAVRVMLTVTDVIWYTVGVVQSVAVGER